MHHFERIFFYCSCRSVSRMEQKERKEGKLTCPLDQFRLLSFTALTQLTTSYLCSSARNSICNKLHLVKEAFEGAIEKRPIFSTHMSTMPMH